MDTADVNGVIQPCNPNIQNSVFAFNREHGIAADHETVDPPSQSLPTIASCRFEGNNNYPIALYNNVFADFDGKNRLNFTTGSPNGIRINGSMNTPGTLEYPGDDFAYVLAGDLEILPGATLNIQPGVIVKVNGYYDTLDVAGGSLNARGMPGERIYFTSIADDTVGGDTNGDGKASSPAKNDWGGIYFHWSDDGLSAAGGALTHCVLRYGGGQQAGLVELSGASVLIDRCIFEYSSEHGVWMGSENSQSSNPVITNNIIRGNKDCGIRTGGGSQPVIKGNAFTGNDFGICNEDVSVCVDARYNDWGHTLGPDDDSDEADCAKTAGGVYYNPNQGGDRVSNHVIYSDWMIAALEAAPVAPANLRVLQTEDGSVQLFWQDLSDNEDGFRVERMAKGEDVFSLLADLPENTVMYRDTDLSGAASFVYRIASYNTAGASHSTSRGLLWPQPVETAVPGTDFSAEPLTGATPLTVSFSDASKGTVTAWYWDFGDGTVSGEQNPTHVYEKAGTYAVTLLVKGPGGRDAAVKTDYITVSGNAVPAASVEPFIHDFGAATANAEPVSHTFTITNTGSANLEVKALRISGDDPSGFSITNNTCIEKTVTPAGSCTADITFSPEKTGQQHADLIIASNDPERPTAGAVLKGEGVPDSTCTFTVLEDTVLEEDTTLSAGTYRITGDIEVPEGITLTLEAGAVLKFDDYNRTVLVSGGVLNANGTALNPVVLTSAADNRYGCLIPDQGKPESGDWGGVIFTWSDDDTIAAKGNMTHCVFAYGGGQQNGLVEIMGTSPVFSHCIFEYSRDNGIWMTPAVIEDTAIPFTPVIRDCRIAFNDDDGIGAEHDATVTSSQSLPIIESCEFEGNRDDAMEFEGNVFGNFDGRNRVLFTRGCRNGIEIKGDIDTAGVLEIPGENFAYVVSGSDLNIVEGGILNIEPGVIVKFDDYNRTIDVAGGQLFARGAVEEEIVFTSNADDTVGGDTNGNGNADGPDPGDWGGIVFRWSEDEATVSEGMMEHCVLRYGGGQQSGLVEIFGTSPVFNRCTFEYSSDSGIWMRPFEAADGVRPFTPTVNECRIAFNRDDGINADHNAVTPPSQSLPVINSCEFEGNDDNAIYFEDNVFAVYDGLNRMVFTRGCRNGIEIQGDVNTTGVLKYPGEKFSYILGSDLTILKDGIVDVTPGVVIKADDHNRTVDVWGGQFFARGNPKEKIFFTSFADDTVGGDTNGNTDADGPDPGDWGGILFRWSEYGTTVSKGSIEHCVLKYGGGQQNGLVEILGSDPTIEYAIFSSSNEHGIAMDSENGTAPAPVIRNNVIVNNNDSGVWTTGGAQPSILSNRFDGNDWAVNNDDPAVCVDARSNDWGHPEGPFDDSDADDCVKAKGYAYYNPGGGGGRVSDDVIYENWIETTGELPLAPSNLMVMLADHDTATLLWQDFSDNEYGFRIERKTGADSVFVPIADLPADSIGFTDADLLKGTATVYRVAAYNRTGLSEYSNEKNVIWHAKAAPHADFSANPTTGEFLAAAGEISMEVTFTNTSTGQIDSFFWEFGDGQTSEAENPVHTYGAEGLYTVILSAVGPGGRQRKIKTDYISVVRIYRPDISIAPASHDFSSATVGLAPLEQEIVITNKGDTNLNLGAISMTGPDAVHFKLLGENCSGKALVPSSPCTLTAAFAPETSGPKTVFLSIVSDDPDTPVVQVKFTGVGTILKGDVDYDGKIDLKDAMLPLKTLSAKGPLDIDVKADMDGDGKIGLGDAILILNQADSGGGGGVSEEDRLLAVQKVEAAMPIISDNDFSAAKIKFAEALALDPENPKANAGYSLSVMGENTGVRTSVLKGLLSSLQDNDLSSGHSLINQLMNVFSGLPFINMSSMRTPSASPQSLNPLRQSLDTDFDLEIADALKEIVLRVTHGVPLMDTNYFATMTLIKSLLNEYSGLLEFILPYIRKAQKMADLQFEIPVETFKELFNYDLDGDGVNDFSIPGDTICIDQGDFYLIDALISMVIAVSDVFSAYSFKGASFEVAGDINDDGYIDVDEYMPPSPYYTLLPDAAAKLLNAKMHLLTAVEKLDAGLTITLNEPVDHYELLPVNSDPEFKSWLESLKNSSTFIDLEDLKGMSQGVYSLDLSKGPFFLSGQSLRADSIKFFDNPKDLRSYLPSVKLSDGTMVYRTDPTLGGNIPDGDIDDVFNFAIGRSSLTTIPIIESLSPEEVNIGGIITIAGKGFGDSMGESRISVANRPISVDSVLSWSDTQIRITATSDLVPGRLVVTVDDFRSNSRRLALSGVTADNFDEVPSAQMAGDPPTTIDSGLFVYDIIDTENPRNASKSNWKIADGFLKEGSDIYRTGGSTLPDVNLARGSNLIMKDHLFSDGTLTVGFGVNASSLTGTDNDGIGVIFRYKDENNFYRLMSVRESYWDKGPWTRLEKWVDGELTILSLSTDAQDVYKSAKDDDLQTGDINEFSVEVSGGKIKIFLRLFQNNTWGTPKLIFDVTDSQFASGRVGVSTYSMWWAFIDYIMIK